MSNLNNILNIRKTSYEKELKKELIQLSSWFIWVDDYTFNNYLNSFLEFKGKKNILE